MTAIVPEPGVLLSAELTVSCGEPVALSELLASSAVNGPTGVAVRITEPAKPGVNVTVTVADLDVPVVIVPRLAPGDNVKGAPTASEADTGTGVPLPLVPLNPKDPETPVAVITAEKDADVVPGGTVIELGVTSTPVGLPVSEIVTDPANPDARVTAIVTGTVWPMNPASEAADRLNAGLTLMLPDVVTAIVPPCATPEKPRLVLLVETELSTVTVKAALVFPDATVIDGGLNEKPLAGDGVTTTAPPNPVSRLTVTVIPVLPPANVLAEFTERVKPGIIATATDDDCVNGCTVPVNVRDPGAVAVTV